jgi:hypothetical protein
VPGKNATIGVGITGEADFDQAKRDAKRDLAVIADAGDDAAEEIEDAFRTLSPELDTRQIRQALDLASQLDDMTASLTVDADISELEDAERLARQLRAFQAKVELTTEGREELRDALNLSEQLERIRKVRLEVEGEEALRQAAELADDIERRRTVPIDAQASDLVRLDDQIGDAITAGGEAGAEGLASALGDVDYGDIGASARDQLTGALAAAGPWVAVAAGVGALFGDEFLEGFNNALPDGRGDAIRQLRNNLSDEDMQRVGVAGGRAYSAGLSDGLAGAKDAAALIQGELSRLDRSINLTEVTRQAQALEQVFGVELTDSVAAVDKLLSQGLVRNSEEGFNLLFELGRQTGVQFDEMIELTGEFSNAVKNLGIDGPKGLKLIGQMVEQGIFPQVDQAGEVFEELNETIISGGANEALEKIGLNAAFVQETIAKGGPRAAEQVAEIARHILAIPSAADRASASTEIFGGNMGLLGDEARDAALELFATADGTAEVGSAASRAADQIEESATGLDRLKLVAIDLGNELGGTVADGLDTLNSLAKMDFSDAADSAASFGEALAIKLLGPLGELADKAGLDPFGPLKDSWDQLTGKADDLPPKLATTIEKLDETTEASEDLSGGMYDAAGAVEELESNVRALFDFTPDQLLRDVAQAADDLAESFKNGGAEAVGMGGQIDISTEAGRDLQSQMEDVNGILQDLAIAMFNNEITADQYAAATGELTGALQGTGTEAGVTKDKVEGLRQKYLDVEGIDVIKTDFEANTERALSNVTVLSRAIANIRDKSITISASVSGPVGVTGTIQRRARGGWTQGLTLVGEEGPELVEVQGRAFVHTAAETRSLLASEPTGPAPAPVTAGRSFIQNATIVMERGVDLWQQALLAEQVFRTL